MCSRQETYLGRLEIRRVLKFLSNLFQPAEQFLSDIRTPAEEHLCNVRQRRLHESAPFFKSLMIKWLGLTMEL